MLRPTSIFIDDSNQKKLAKLAASKGLATAQLVRLAISEYLRRELRRVV